MSGKRIIPIEDMLAKIKAALDARTDPDFMIMARTDAIAVEGIDAALERARLFQDVGADMIFIEAPQNIEQMRLIASEVKVPAMANMIPGGATPVLPAAELQKMGFAIVAFPTVNTYAIAKATKELFGHIARHGSFMGLEDRFMEFEEFNGLVGLPQIRELEHYYYKDIKEDA